MPESRPARGIISTENLIADKAATIVSATSEKNLLRKERLRDPRRGRRWRSTSDAQQKVVVKLEVADLPQVIALMDCNAASGQTITVKSATDEAISANVSQWDFTSYVQTRRKVLAWYPGAEDSGVSAADRLYWEFTFPASGTLDSNGDGTNDDFWEVGNIWVGDVQTISMARISTDVIDPSEVAVSDAGARFPDPRDTYHEKRITSDGIPEADVFTLLDDLDEAGIVRHVFLDKFAASTDATKKAKGAYYGTLGRGDGVAGFDRGLPQHEDLTLSFAEARA